MLQFSRRKMCESVRTNGCVCVHVRVSVSVCVCVHMLESERKRDERKRERERECHLLFHIVSKKLSAGPFQVREEKVKNGFS